jgi:hypothetical protein
VISDELEEEEDVDDEDKSEQDHSFKVDFKVCTSFKWSLIFLSGSAADLTLSTGFFFFFLIVSGLLNFLLGWL